jgi:predicted ATPase
MLIHAIKLNSFLSFGETSAAILLQSLNVIIGPNGSGKSNLLESIELLRSTPEQLLKPIREGGGYAIGSGKVLQGCPAYSAVFLLPL